jgi:hypothetical protein
MVHHRLDGLHHTVNDPFHLLAEAVGEGRHVSASGRAPTLPDPLNDLRRVNARNAVDGISGPGGPRMAHPLPPAGLAEECVLVVDRWHGRKVRSGRTCHS